MQAAVKDKKHEEQKQRQDNSSASTAQRLKKDVLQPGPKDSVDEANSKPYYPLPPTEIHDGWLFRKVG